MQLLVAFSADDWSLLDLWLGTLDSAFRLLVCLLLLIVAVCRRLVNWIGLVIQSRVLLAISRTPWLLLLILHTTILSYWLLLLCLVILLFVHEFL